MSKHGFDGQMNACWTKKMSWTETESIHASRFPISVIHGRLQKVKFRSLHGQAKVTETLVTNLKMTCHQKRKIDETNIEGHEELGSESLLEHKEFTKVKNNATIKLERYEIET